MPAVRTLLIVAALICFSEAVVWAEDSVVAGDAAPRPVPAHGASYAGNSRGPSLVFDPESKKYFIGGNAKFMLRQSQGSSVIDRIEVSVDGSEYTEYVDGISLKDEGKHSIKFRAINPVNNWSPVQFVELFLDLTPPTTQTKFEEGRFFRKDASGSVEGQDVYAALGSTLSFLAQDNLSGVTSIEYAWDTEAAFLPYTKPILIDKTGRRVLFYRSTDRVGNIEPSRQVTFIADGTPPVSELKINGGPLKPTLINGVNYLSTRDSISFAVEAQDSESGVREMMVSIDGKPATRFLKPIFFLQEGPHTLSYFSDDNCGNREVAKSISVYSISTAPQTIASTIGKVVSKGGVNYARRDLRLKLSAEDNVVGLDRLEYRLEPNPEYTYYSEPIRFEKIGESTIVYRSVDRAGNIENARSYRVLITETAPETKVETSQPLTTRDSTVYSPSPNLVSLRPSATGVSVEQTLYSINDGPFVKYTAPIPISSEQRIYKINYKSIDELGNEEPAKTVTYHMIGSTPMVDLFVSDGVNMQEQVRTDFFDRPQSGGSKPAPKRAISSTPAPTPAPAVAPTEAPAQTAPVAPAPKAKGAKRKGP